MAICTQCNHEGGEQKFCQNCGAPLMRERRCPECGGALDGTSRLCPECGFVLSKQGALSEQGAAAGGLRTGDIGFIKGNVDSSTHISHAGATAGNINIAIQPPQQPAEASAPHAVCPICGAYPEKRESFRCLRCNRDWICIRHRDPALNWCENCAAVEKARREVEVLRAENLRLQQETQKRGEEENRRSERFNPDEPRRAPEKDQIRRIVQQPPENQGTAAGEQKSTPVQPVQLIGTGAIRTNLPEQKLTSIVTEVLQSFGLKKARFDPATRTIKGTTGFTWQSIGQVVSATIQPLPDGSSVTITSRPKPPQLVDAGRGAADVQRITDMLLQRLSTGL